MFQSTLSLSLSIILLPASSVRNSVLQWVSETQSSLQKPVFAFACYEKPIKYGT